MTISELFENIPPEYIIILKGIQIVFRRMMMYVAIFAYAAFYIYYKSYRVKCMCRNTMQGKVAIVTGANSGIGFETALELARRGARVILACRDEGCGRSARVKIIAATGNTDIICYHLDLTSFASVRLFAFEVMSTENKIDLLINNAGVAYADNTLTADKVTVETQVNYFGPFLLTMLLVEWIKMATAGRIINISSFMHFYGRVNPMTFPQPPRDFWSQKRIFADTKLATVLFTFELSRFLENTNVTVNCVDPGLVYSNLYRNMPFLVRLLMKMFFSTAKDGAQTVVHLATSPGLEQISGRYYSDCKEARPAPRALDRVLAGRLWRISQRVVNFLEHYDHGI